MRQAGTWDLGPLAAVLATGQMSPGGEQNTKECKTLHTWAVWAIMNNKIQKGHKPTATSKVPGEKAGDCAWSLNTAPPRGWVDHLSTPTFTPLKEPACPPCRGSKGTGTWSHPLLPQHQSQRSLAWMPPLTTYQFLLIKESKDPNPYQY